MIDDTSTLTDIRTALDDCGASDLRIRRLGPGWEASTGSGRYYGTTLAEAVTTAIRARRADRGDRRTHDER